MYVTLWILADCSHDVASWALSAIADAAAGVVCSTSVTQLGIATVNSPVHVFDIRRKKSA